MPLYKVYNLEMKNDLRCFSCSFWYFRFGCCALLLTNYIRVKRFLAEEVLSRSTTFKCSYSLLDIKAFPAAFTTTFFLTFAEIVGFFHQEIQVVMVCPIFPTVWLI